MNANIFPKKERLGLVYGRYMDDFYIISSDKLLLRRILKEIEEYIYHLRQSMDSYFFGYFPELKPNPKGDNTHGPKTEQPRKQVED